MKNRMNKHFHLMTCLGVMLLTTFSCEKMQVEEDGSEDISNITIRISTIEQVPFRTATRAAVLNEVCTHLNFLLYKESGERVSQVSQNIEDDGFGEARFTVPPGRYLLTALAHSSDGNPTSTNMQRIGFTNKTGYTDTFFCLDTLDVGEADIERALSLKRIVAKVRFIPYDELPENAQRIGFNYTGGSGTLDATNNGWGVVNSKQMQYYQLSREEKYFEIYTIPHATDDDELDVIISTYVPDADGSDVLKTERTVEGIPVRRNHITTCRGYLFSPVYQMNLSITIDDTWDADTLSFDFY